jgi:hypothetical protein
MTMTDAAERVLREHSRGAPMHYRRITELAVEHGWILPGGATPEASVNAAVTSEIKRRSIADREQRFESRGRGLYALAVPVDPLGGAIDSKNSEVRSRLRALLADLDPRLFENLIGQLLAALGFEDVVVTRYSNDGGIDVRARLAVGGVTDVRTAVQVKRWTNSVSGRTVRELRGGLGPHERGLVITLSTFTKDARAEAGAADRSPISLVDGDRLVELLIDNDIGVSRRRVTILELDEGSLLPLGDVAPEAPEPTADTLNRSSARTLQTDKVLSVWPLPGGGNVWKQTLDAMLEYVAEVGPSMRDAIEWMILKFDRVKSEKVARGYWQVPRSFGLVETRGERLVLTADGATYMASKATDVLLGLLRKSVAGFDELLLHLSLNATISADEGLSLLNTRLGVGWESDAQVKFRFGWLENLEVVIQHSGVWKLA